MLELSLEIIDHQHLSLIASSFRDLWVKAISVMSKEWSLRFAKVIQRDVSANFLESQNLRQDVDHLVSSYISERRKSGMIETHIVCIKYPSLNMSL